MYSTDTMFLKYSHKMSNIHNTNNKTAKYQGTDPCPEGAMKYKQHCTLLSGI